MRSASIRAAVLVTASLGVLGAGGEGGREPPERGALAVPAQAREDPAAVELARLWVADGRLQVSLRIQPVQDPGTWGAMLAEVVRHLGHAYAQADRGDRVETIDRIVQAFGANLRYSSDGLRGEISEPAPGP